MSKYVPNSFQTPNAIIDELMPLLTDSEFRVLMFMVRSILGWESSAETKRARISQSVMENGRDYIDKEGLEQHSPGCGLARNTIKKALETLKLYRIIKAIGKPNNDGQMWELCLLTDSNPDIVSLKLRADAQANKARKRTAKARKANPKNTAGVSVQQIPPETDRGISPTDSQGISPTDPRGVSPTDTNKTHRNTEETHIAAQAPETKPMKPAEVIGQVLDKPPVTGSDWSLYGKVCKELAEGGIEPDEYPDYVAWVKKQSKAQGGWSVTVSSLTSKGRVSDYVAEKNAKPVKQPELVPLDDDNDLVYQILTGERSA